MVLASRPVVSARRLAARPVGAHKPHFSFLALKTSRMPRTIVVLPTPGPPVTTRTLDDVRLRIAAMPLMAQLLQDVAQGGLGAQRRIAGDAQAAGQLVGGLKAHAPDVARQAIRIGANQVDGLVPVRLVDAYRPGGAH